MNKVIKNILVFDIISQTKWYEREKNNLNSLSVKTRWNLKKNIKEIQKISSSFYEFKDSLQNQLKEKYSSDERSIEEQIDQNGQKTLVRKIKDEYLKEYQKQVNEMNAKLDQLLKEREEILIYPINMDEEIENMAADANLSDESMQMLMFYMNDEEDAE